MSVDSTAVGQLWVGVGVYVRSQHSSGPAHCVVHHKLFRTELLVTKYLSFVVSGHI